jgi:hypothetical protein
MSKFLYSVWFLDTDAYGDDQDREWVACFGIEAASEKDAQRWGDTLARDRAHRHQRDTFLHSSIEPEDQVRGVTDWSSLPRIRAGEAVSDDVIGW